MWLLCRTCDIRDLFFRLVYCTSSQPDFLCCVVLSPAPVRPLFLSGIILRTVNARLQHPACLCRHGRYSGGASRAAPRPAGSFDLLVYTDTEAAVPVTW